MDSNKVRVKLCWLSFLLTIQKKKEPNSQPAFLPSVSCSYFWFGPVWGRISPDDVWHSWFPLVVWLGQVKRPDVTSNPLDLPPCESPQNAHSSLGFSGYKPSIVCPLQHQAQPWCHGYLEGFNWPTIISHSFKNSLHWKKYFSVAHWSSLHSSWFLNLPIQTEHAPTLPAFSFWLFFFSPLNLFPAHFLAIPGNNGTFHTSVLSKVNFFLYMLPHQAADIGKSEHLVAAICTVVIPRTKYYTQRKRRQGLWTLRGHFLCVGKSAKICNLLCNRWSNKGHYSLPTVWN